MQQLKLSRWGRSIACQAMEDHEDGRSLIDGGVRVAAAEPVQGNEAAIRRDQALPPVAPIAPELPDNCAAACRCFGCSHL
jgi:hypothetical protein